MEDGLPPAGRRRRPTCSSHTDTAYVLVTGAAAGHRRGGALLRPAPDRQRHAAGGRDRQPRPPSGSTRRSGRVAPAASAEPRARRSAELEANRAELQAVADAEAAVLAPLTDQAGRRAGRDRPAARHRRPRPRRPGVWSPTTSSTGRDVGARRDGRAGGLAMVGCRAAHPHRRRRRLGHRRRPLGARDPGHHVHRLPHAARTSPPRPSGQTPDLAVLDLQIGNMGGMAVCMNLAPRRVRRPAAPHQGADAARPHGRHSSSPAGRAPRAGWSSRSTRLRLRRAATTVLPGGTVYEGLPPKPSQPSPRGRGRPADDRIGRTTAPNRPVATQVPAR